MRTETKTELLIQNGWTFRFRQAEETPSRVLLLLHGWTGDEDSMWTFTRNLSPRYTIISPRGPYSAPKGKGGYSWRKIKPGTWGAPTLEELRAAADALVSLVDKWLASVKITSTTFDIVGFSQGGALANTIAALHPDRVDKIAVLSGFVPPGVDELLKPHLLDKVSFFWAHGTQDDLILFERARQSIAILQQAGAQVTLCQAEIGHKVSKDCRRALEAFFQD